MAERKISTKFAIQGESEYKNAVKSINQEMKVLSSEMAKVSSEFMDNANSMEALSAQADVLAKQYETQAERVQTMREALENAQNAQQEWADRQEEAAERVEELTRELEDLKNAEGDTTEEQERLTKELQDANDALEYATRGYEAATKGVDDWQVRLNYAEADLNKLNGKIQENAKYLEEARNSTDGCAQSIDQYGKAVKNAGDSSEGMGNQGMAAISKIIGSGGGGIAGLIGYAIKLVGAAKDIAVEMKNAESVMVRGTGASGEALRELNEIYKDVMANSKSASDSVAGSIANLSTRLDLTGEELQANAELFEKFSRAAGVDAADGVNKVADLIYTFGRSAEDIPQILDMLTVASQKSGASVTTLAEAASSSAFYAQEFGLSLEETVGMMAAFEKAGIDANTVSRGMKKSYDDLASTGRTWSATMQGLESGLLTSADAVDLFGTKGANLATVLQNGKVDFDAMTEAIAASGGQMEQTAEVAETFGQKIKGFWNSIWYGGSVGSQYTGFWEFEDEAEELVETVEEEVVPAWQQARDAFVEMAGASEGSAEAIDQLTEYLLSDEAQVLRNVDGYDELIGSLTGLRARFEDLDAEVAEATENVSSNLDGLMGRFNEVPFTVENSTANVIYALQTQQRYMNEYADNMQKAAARGVDEGLLKSLSDGSQESAEILAGIVTATDGEIQLLNEKWNETQQGRENFSQTMSEIQTDFEEKSAALQAEYDEAVQHFNQYSEAQAAGAQTVQGAIDGASAKEGLLDRTYENLGRSAAQSYAAGFNSVPKPEKYAAGTDSASAGWAWVGEQGPELMLMRGGETVFNHEESVALAREAMAAAARADSRSAADLSANVVSVTVKSDVDVRGIEALIAGVIQAVEKKATIDFGAITGGVDRQLARSKKLVGLAGG